MSGDVMEMRREPWSSERLDDLSHRVDEGFRRTETDSHSLRSETQALRSEMREEFRDVRGEMRGEFQAVRADIRALDASVAAQQRTMVQAAWAMVAAYVGGFLGVIAAILVAL